MKKNLPIFIFLLFLILVTYSNALNNAFLSDDLAEIVNNPNIGNLGNAISTHPFGFIRPVLYWISFQIGGLNQIIFRSSNLFFHLGVTLIIFLTFQKLYSKKLALIVSSIFAVHPAASEAGVGISGGMYAQYVVVFFAALYFFISSKKQSSYLLSIIFYLLSLMSHPQAPLSLFLIFPLWEFSFGNLKKNWFKTIPFVIIAITYLIISLGALPERATVLQSTHYQEAGVDNMFVIVPIAISSYFELIFFPKTLTLYHSELAFGQINFGLRALITILFFGTILYCFKKNRYIFFWGSLFILALAPTLTPFRLNWIVAERYLYLPMIGILAIFGLLLEQISHHIKYKKLTYILFALLLTTLSIRTINRNIEWKNEDNLWIATGKTSPSSPNAHNNLGDVYGRWGDKQKALSEFQRAIALKPNYGDAYHNLANTYMELKQLDKALENYENAIKFNPGLWQSYQNIAALYFQDKQYDKALENIQKAIQINPKNINLYNNLGIIYLSMNDKTKAKEVFTLVLSADPQNQFANAGLFEAKK